MKALPTQERARLKRSALIDAAVKEFSRVGFEVATAKSIASLAGVATGTFYQYFENKNDVLRIIATERYQQLQEHIEWFDVQSIERSEFDLSRYFERVLQSIYDFHANNAELHQVLEQRKSSDPELMKIMNEGQSDLLDRTLLFVQSFNLPNSDVIANNLFAMGEGIVHRQVFDKPDIDATEVLELGAKMLASYFISIH